MQGVKISIVLMLCWVIHSTNCVPATGALLEHNRLRKMHGVPPLTMSDSLSSESLRHAKFLAESQSLTHSQSDGMYGENLCLRSSLPLKCVQIWYDENIYYDYSRPRFTFQSGHFTQLMWAGSTEMGWGQAQDANGVYYVVAMYTPAGNIRGEFEANVPRPLYDSNAAFETTAVSINAVIISILFGLLN